MEQVFERKYKEYLFTADFEWKMEKPFNLKMSSAFPKAKNTKIVIGCYQALYCTVGRLLEFL